MTGMDADFSAEDMAEIRKQGDLKSLFATLLGKPDPTVTAPVEDDEPGYHIALPGAWPCGTSATGPVAHCADCAPADGARHLTALPAQPHHPANPDRSAAA